VEESLSERMRERKKSEIKRDIPERVLINCLRE
jgi:hypothetical protein